MYQQHHKKQRVDNIFKKFKERKYETRILYQFNSFSIIKVVENALINTQEFKES